MVVVVGGSGSGSGIGSGSGSGNCSGNCSGSGSGTHCRHIEGSKLSCSLFVAHV